MKPSPHRWNIQQSRLHTSCCADSICTESDHTCLQSSLFEARERCSPMPTTVQEHYFATMQVTHDTTFGLRLSAQGLQRHSAPRGKSRPSNHFASDRVAETLKPGIPESTSLAYHSTRSWGQANQGSKPSHCTIRCWLMLSYNLYDLLVAEKRRPRILQNGALTLIVHGADESLRWRQRATWFCSNMRCPSHLSHLSQRGL